MADTLQQLFREQADLGSVAVQVRRRTWTWRAHVAEASRQAAASSTWRIRHRPLHVGVLLANGPDIALTALAAAALGEATCCASVNTTRRGEGAGPRYRSQWTCQILITDAAHRGRLLEVLICAGVSVVLGLHRASTGSR